MRLIHCLPSVSFPSRRIFRLDNRPSYVTSTGSFVRVVEQSVLQQATSFAKDGDLLASLQEQHSMAGQPHHVPSVSSSNKKQGVSGESSEAGQTSEDIQIQRYDKDFSQKLIVSGVFMPGMMTCQAGNEGSDVFDICCHAWNDDKSDKPKLIVSGVFMPGIMTCQAGNEGSDVFDICCHAWNDDKSDKQKLIVSKQLIKDAIMDNDFLKNLDSSQVRELVDSMYPQEYSKGSYVINEGGSGCHLFVSAEGEFEVIKEDKVLGRMGPGKAFGELAILYNCTRTASIRVVNDAKVWVLDRRVFQQIMMRTGLQRLEDNINFLRSVPLLTELSNEVLAKIADVLEVEFYPVGAHIIRQGASGDTFFIISGGSVKVTQRLPGRRDEDEIRTLQRGDYFGEQALLKEDCRTASVIAMHPGVECLTLDRDSFIQLIGDLSELHEKDYGDESRGLSRPSSSGSIYSDSEQGDDDTGLIQSGYRVHEWKIES
uniref:Cyclic nucleotide-binding domain-containing protein n=1 Tax=Timema douglasi TaxID=61478 RepID=A0A7R8VU52_TIMDO|nr:unnamed protein product [Timema douglasi]